MPKSNAAAITTGTTIRFHRLGNAALNRITMVVERCDTLANPDYIEAHGTRINAKGETIGEFYAPSLYLSAVEILAA